MRLSLIGLLALPALLGACGHSSSSTLTVTCGGATALVGASRVEVGVDPASKATLLSFPDPVNEGRTGTIPVVPPQRCTIAPTVQ